MAFGVDATGTYSGDNGNITEPTTWTHVCSSDATLLLMMMCTGSSVAGERDVDAASYNSSAGTQVAELDDGAWEMASMWVKTSPSSGSNTVSMSLASEGGAPQGAGYSISFDDASTTLGATGTATGNTATVPVPTTGAIATNVGDILVAVCANDSSGTNFTVQGSGVLIGEDEDVDADSDFSAQYVVATGSTTEASWNSLPDNGHWVIAYAVVQPAAVSVEQASYRFFSAGDELPHYDLTQPVIDSSDDTTTDVTVAADPWSINYPNAATGDLLLFILTWDDSTNVTSVVAPAGPNGETISTIAGPIASNGTEIRSQAYYTVATGTWTASTLSFNPSASETCTATVIKVLAGEFNASDPIGAAATRASTASTDSNVLSPAFTAEAGDGTGTLVILFSSDADAITAPGSDWSTVRNVNVAGVGHLVGVRSSAVTSSESIAALTATITSDSWCTIGFVVKPPIVADGRTPFAAINTGATLEVDTDYGCSIRVYSSGATTAEDTWQWQYNKNSAGWNNVTGASSVIRATATADFADGDDVQEYLTGSGTYVTNNNAALETDGTLVLAAVLGAGQAFESHLNFQVRSGDVVDEDSVLLRVVYEDGTELDTYTNTATITVNEGGATGQPTSKRFGGVRYMAFPGRKMVW